MSHWYCTVCNHVVESTYVRCPRCGRRRADVGSSKLPRLSEMRATPAERFRAALELIAAGELRGASPDGLGTYRLPPDQQAAYMRGIASAALEMDNLELREETL